MKDNFLYFSETEQQSSVQQNAFLAASIQASAAAIIMPFQTLCYPMAHIDLLTFPLP